MTAMVVLPPLVAGELMVMLTPALMLTTVLPAGMPVPLICWPTLILVVSDMLMTLLPLVVVPYLLTLEPMTHVPLPILFSVVLPPVPSPSTRLKVLAPRLEPPSVRVLSPEPVKATAAEAFGSPRVSVSLSAVPSVTSMPAESPVPRVKDRSVTAAAVL